MTDSQLQQKRLIAAVIDMAVLVVLAVVTGLVNIALTCTGALGDSTFAAYVVPVLILLFSAGALLFVLLRDLLAGGRSPGKHFMGVRVVSAAGGPITIVDSVKRNALFAPTFVLSFVGSVLGLLPLGSCVACMLTPLNILAALAAVGAVVWEIIQIVQDPNGIRVGDRIAGTRVIL